MKNSIRKRLRVVAAILQHVAKHNEEAEDGVPYNNLVEYSEDMDESVDDDASAADEKESASGSRYKVMPGHGQTLSDNKGV